MPEQPRDDCQNCGHKVQLVEVNGTNRFNWVHVDPLATSCSQPVPKTPGWS
jgi:hypothetical protein